MPPKSASEVAVLASTVPAAEVSPPAEEELEEVASPPQAVRASAATTLRRAALRNPRMVINPSIFREPPDWRSIRTVGTIRKQTGSPA